jgi:transposase
LQHLSLRGQPARAPLLRSVSGVRAAPVADHAAGDKVFVDYSGKKIMIVDRATRVLREAEIFVAVFGSSKYTYAEATWTQKLDEAPLG